ncbi:hypothetical protein ACFXA3_06440 [Streptomyces sp. NPDC059456]|uniref:hypothetical protein n=1 Tax=Streptomyces sp. NPDC059456 TaxID=3346838 RepID=UPI003675641A
MWNPAWSRARRHGGAWVVALVASALVVLLFGVCDSGGHHHVAVPDRATSSAGTVMTGGCPDRDLPCAHAHDEHVAAPVPELRVPGAPAELGSGVLVESPAAGIRGAAADTSAAPPAAGSGRSLLCKVCVTRT